MLSSRALNVHTSVIASKFNISKGPIVKAGPCCRWLIALQISAWFLFGR